MTEEHTTGSLERLIDNLDDCNLNVINYQALQNAVDSDDYISEIVVDKLLAILCQEGRNDDVKYTAHILNIFFSCLKKFKEGKCSFTPNFTHSALQVLKVLKTTAYYNQVEALKVLCFDTLLSYPDKTLVDLGENHKDEVIEIVNLFCNRLMPIEIRLQPVVLIAKLLKTLPPDKRTGFIKDELNTWFGKVIPAVITVSSIESSADIVLKAVEALELLTEDLVKYEYSDNCEWQCLNMYLYTPKKYPEIMKSLLENGVGHWYRLWIIFVKLLKNQITKSTSNSVSPVNSMLPVVEMAFKMDDINRCKAFLCWNALIDNFSQEKTESSLDKRIKLLVIPLLSNNAKVEKTALAKLKTWWHLICKFQFVIDNYLEMILIRFLHFCFGKPSGTAFVPGKISKETKIKCVEAFINLVGHSQCNGCVCLTKLDRKLLNTKLFVSHWKDWLHSIRCAIKICVEYDSAFSERHIVCVWKSLVMIISELPENNIRTDLFNEVICLLENMTQECDTRVTSTIIYNLIPILFDNEDCIRPLLKSKHEQNSPISKIIKILINLHLDIFDNEKTLKGLKAVTNNILDESLTNSTCKNKIQWMLNDLSSKGMLLWTAMADSIRCLKYNKCRDTLLKMILWPLKHLNALVDKDLPQNVWLDLYKFIIPYVKIDEANDEIIKALQENYTGPSCDVFTINATVAMLQQKLQQGDTSKFDREAELLLHVSGKISETEILVLLPSLTVIIVQLLNNLGKIPNTQVAKHVVLIFNNVLKSCSLSFKDLNENGDLLKNIEEILKSLESILNMKVYSTLKVLLIDQLKNCANFFTKHKSVVNLILSVYNNDNKSSVEDICRSVIKAYENTKNESGKQQENEKKFSKPGDNIMKKKTKKETKIINTTVENGEEFVVVQSNWKFNLKKMTDNQKEKLQRKREDIPALYQDLSQSQDEFQLKTWKIDSQDSSSMSSKSANVPTNEDTTNILENIPKSDFIPKMLQNIQPSQQNSDQKLKSNNDTTKLQNENIKAAKDLKSPRLSLKDRVFRNVRNLMEKSNVPNELSGDKSNNTENILNTPIMCKSKPSADMMKSAPSQLFADRPSRVKRKPKKFEDLQLISTKKRRCSVNSTESSNSDSQVNECVNTEGQNIDVKTDMANIKEIDLRGKGVEYDTIKEPRHKNKNATKIDVTPEIKINGRNDSVMEVEDCNKSIEYRKVTIDEKIGAASSPVAANRAEKASDNKTKETVQGNSPSLIDKKVKENIADILCSEDFKSKLDKKSFSSHTNNISETVIQGITIPDKAEITSNSSVTPKVKKLREKRREKSDSDNKKDNLKSDVSKIKENELSFNIEDTEMADNTETNERIQDKILHNHTEKDLIERDGKITEKFEDKRQKSKTGLADNSCPNDTNKCTISPSNINKMIDNDSTKTSTISTPKINNEKSTNKTPKLKMSRIQSQLAIDTVEGHPLLKVQSEKRLTRKAVSKFPRRRKSVDTMMVKNTNIKNISKTEKKVRSIENDQSMLITETQNTEESLASQDIIESSQDSTVTTISVKSNKVVDKRVPIVMLKSLEHNNNTPSQSLLDKSDDIDLTNMGSECDLDLPPNKTIVTDLTENMDTEPVDDSLNNVVLSGEANNIFIARSEDAPVGDTQNTAEADTQALNPNMFRDNSECNSSVEPAITLETNTSNDSVIEIIDDDNVIDTSVATADDVTETMIETITVDSEKDDASSPCRDEHKRKEDFLNNTIEISPIKAMSPLRENKSPSPETSTDYVVIKLASPVQSNGEPYEKGESPEVFTEDKVSSDIRDRSPPRSEVNTTTSSPSSSLSMKKNRPQVRSGGRAAQMLGLCVPDKLQTIALTEKSTDAEESRKSPSLNTPARRNLRILYNSANVENEDHSEETEDNENFLSFKRTLPTTDCSPSGPILKRKLADIIDETTASPASKRKRVSFHDPPVSTTICVKKYIEPCGVRSPQNSAIKRQERQTRSHTPLKSPRRLENVFKLDSALTKTVESFTEMTDTLNTESSLEQTPVLEVVKASDLNDIDAICLELVDCKDPIANIAEDLSSRSMKTLLLKELEGKVDTISDLAKMTELEVNRLCIKAPKVETVKKALNEYLLKIQKVAEEITPTIEAAMSESLSESKTSVEIQTNDVTVENIEMQTDETELNESSSQTNSVLTLNCSVQTEESGYKSTVDIVRNCLSERPDFVQKLCDTLDESSKKKLADGLSFDTLNETLLEKLTASKSTVALESFLGKHQKLALTNEETKPVLHILQNYLIERFDCKDLIMFCANLLQEVHRKS